MVQRNSVPSDNKTQASLTNGQVFIQKGDGVFQFYLQAGAYNMPSLATPFLETDKTISNFYGPMPVGFVKVQAGKNTSFLVGSLPTWGYSRNWGYGPGGGVGLLLIILIVLALSGRI